MWGSGEISHDILAIEVGRYFSTFFAAEARRNNNRFDGYAQWVKHSIYNYQVTTSYGPFEQFYFF